MPRSAQAEYLAKVRADPDFGWTYIWLRRGESIGLHELYCIDRALGYTAEPVSLVLSDDPEAACRVLSDLLAEIEDGLVFTDEDFDDQDN